MHTQCVLSGIHNSNPLIQFNNNNKKKTRMTTITETIITTTTFVQDVYSYTSETIFLGYTVLQLFCGYSLVTIHGTCNVISLVECFVLSH